MELKDVSLRDLENFSNHPVWVLLEDTLKEKVELLRNDLERGFRTESDEHGKTYIFRYDIETVVGKQHECASYRYVMRLLEVWKEEKKQIEESKNAKTN